jgi:Leu/Phe-tRNA-protein transferase
MNNIQLGIHHLPYDEITNPEILHRFIYPDMLKNYYWSDDFSPEYYIAQAKAGFIAVTDYYEEKELLLPEIQFSYALLDFRDLHISRKAKKLLNKKELQLEISQNLDEVVAGINKSHKNNWLTPRYFDTLKATQNIDENFKMISACIRNEKKVIAGEIGYIIGKTYTSLSGFSSREKKYHNYGTVQLVLLAKYLEKNHFAFWNLGQPYMSYKLALGAKVYERQAFLKRWFEATRPSTS